jgi:hypothetical protein
MERVVTKRQSGIWNLGERRESDTWRDLVDSMTRDQVSCVQCDRLSS